jgi:hypothetical protein
MTAMPADAAADAAVDAVPAAVVDVVGVADKTIRTFFFLILQI